MKPNYHCVVGIADTPLSLIEFLRKGAVIISDEAGKVLARAARDGVPVCTGSHGVIELTPSALAMPTGSTYLDFYNAAFRLGLEDLPLLAAMRLLLEVPPARSPVRCSMEPLPDDDGYDMVFTYSWTDKEIPVLGCAYSYLFEYNADEVIDPDQRTLFRIPSALASSP